MLVPNPRPAFSSYSCKGATLIELALLMPILLLLLSGVVSLGDLVTQQPWTAQSAYQLAETLAVASREAGLGAMATRRDQIQAERGARFQRFSLQISPPEPLTETPFNGEFWGEIPSGVPLGSSNVEMVGVSFFAEIGTAWNTTIRTPLRISITAPHLARKVTTNGLAPYADPPGTERFDCCGNSCSGGGAGCSGGGDQCWTGLGGTPRCLAGNPTNPLVW